MKSSLIAIFGPQSLKVDPFDFEKKAEVFKYWPMSFHGVDKLHRPINYQKLGGIS